MERDDVVKESARSWVVVACCFFCNLTFYGVSRLSGIMLLATTQAFNVSRARAAVPFSLATAVRSLSGVFVGHLGHRFGVGPVVAAGCLIASLGSGLCFFAKDMLWLTVCWGGVFGFGFGLCTCLLPLAINQNFSKYLGTASGISYSGSYIGSFIFPPVFVWLLDTFALQGTFLIISSGVLNVLVAALLLMDPKKSKSKKISSENNNMDCAISEDSKIHRRSTGQPYFLESSEMWRRNIQMAYMASQDGLEEDKYKQNYRHSISFSSSPYYLEGLTYRASSAGKECEADGIHPRNHFLPSQDSHNYHHFSPKLFNICDSPAECDKTSASQNIPRSVHFTSSIRDVDCLHSTNDSPAHSAGSINSCAKPTLKNPRGCSKKPLENKLPFRIRLKAKFKLKLQKLKKVLVASLLKHESPYLKEFAQTENVRLTSYRNLHQSSSLFVPSKCPYLSLPRDFYGIRCPASDLGSGHSNSAASLQHSTKSRERFSSLPVLGLNGQRGILPVIHGSYFDSSDFLVYTERSHDCTAGSNCCNASACTKRDGTSMFLSGDNDCRSLNVKNMHGNTTTFSKKGEETQSPRASLSLSPELLLRDKTDFKAQKRKDSLMSQSKSPRAESCFLDWVRMFRDPVFVIIAFTMSIQTLMLVSVVTTIEDYARDVGIPDNQTHYSLMALSIANLVGTLTLGSITDRGLVSRPRFMFLCFLGMSLSLVAVSLFASSLPSLLSLVVIYGLLESGIVITFPVLTKQFVKGQRRQAIAIASSNVLSVPTIMLVPILIGFFRDYIGSYTGLFQLLGATSLSCSLLWLLAPSICKKRKQKSIPPHLDTEKC